LNRLSYRPRSGSGLQRVLGARQSEFRWPGKRYKARSKNGCLGLCGPRDTFHTERGGRDSRQTFIGTYAQAGFAKRHDRKTIMAADLRNSRVRPSMGRTAPDRVLADPATEKRGTDDHPQCKRSLVVEKSPFLPAIPPIFAWRNLWLASSRRSFTSSRPARRRHTDCRRGARKAHGRTRRRAAVDEQTGTRRYPGSTEAEPCAWQSESSLRTLRDSPAGFAMPPRSTTRNIS